MLDVASESIISLTQAARLLPPPGRRGRPVSLSCVLRWVLTGATGPSGARVRLEAVRLGGRWVTSRQALQRFAERLTPRLDREPAPAPQSPAQRLRDSERAARELAKVGI
jgi:hypothetical protein